MVGVLGSITSAMIGPPFGPMLVQVLNSADAMFTQNRHNKASAAMHKPFKWQECRTDLHPVVGPLSILMSHKIEISQPEPEPETTLLFYTAILTKSTNGKAFDWQDRSGCRSVPGAADLGALPIPPLSG